MFPNNKKITMKMKIIVVVGVVLGRSRSRSIGKIGVAGVVAGTGKLVLLAKKKYNSTNNLVLLAVS